MKYNSLNIVIGKLIIIDNNLFFKNEDWLLKVNNVTSNDKGFFQIAGWYVYKEPLDLDDFNYEVKILNDKYCHLIKKYE